MENDGYCIWPNCGVSFVTVFVFISQLTSKPQVPLVLQKWLPISDAVYEKSVASNKAKEDANQKRVDKYNKRVEKYNEQLNAYENPKPASRKKQAVKSEEVPTVIDLSAPSSSKAPETAGKKPPTAPKKPKLDEIEPPAPPRIKEGQDTLFLDLSTAMSILLSTAITDDEIGKAEEHLFRYLKRFKEVSRTSLQFSISYSWWCLYRSTVRQR